MLRTTPSRDTQGFQYAGEFLEPILGGTTCLTLLCLMRPVGLCVVHRVKDRFNLLHHSQLLKSTCVRQVVVDSGSGPIKYLSGPISG